MKETTNTFGIGLDAVICKVAAQAKVSTLKGVYYTSYFFNEVGQILSHAQLRPVKGEINALEAAKTQDDADKAMRLLKKAAEAANLPTPVITAGVGEFVSARGDRYTKSLKSFVGKDEKAFEVLKNLPDPLGLVDKEVMKNFLVYKGEVLCTNPFNQIEKDSAKSLLKFSRMWAKCKNLTTHIGWLIKSALVPDEHGTERAAIVLDCIEDHVKDLGFLAGAKEVYYYLFNNDSSYGPVGIGSEAKISRYLNGYFADKFSDEEALTWALKGATSPEIAKLVGDRLGYLVAGFGCPAEVPEYLLNREERFFDRSHELDGLWEEREKVLREEQLPTWDRKEAYNLEMLPLIIARSLGLPKVIEWALETGRTSEEAIGSICAKFNYFAQVETWYFESYSERYNPQTAFEVFKTYQKAIIENYDETSPEAHRIASTIGELDALAKFPNDIYLHTVDADGNEINITNEEFITNLLVTLEEFLTSPEKLFERKNVTVDPVTREVKEAPPEILSVGRLILEDEPYGFKTDKILFYEDPTDPCGVPLIDKILSGECSYRRNERSFDQGNLSWLKVKSVFESNDAFDGESYEDLYDLYGEDYDEDDEDLDF